MTRTASAALTPLAEARALLLSLAAPLRPETARIADALGCICAVPVTAPGPHPSRPTTLRDGYAVEAASIGGASPYSPLRLPQAPDWVEAGEALPPGTDAVLPPEGLEGRDAVADLAPREGVRAPGEDFQAGDGLIRPGERIGPLHLLALAACGVATVAVRRPRIALIVTGGPELDALSPVLAALVARQGGVAETVTVPDEPGALVDALRGSPADTILVIGGTGFGRTDHSAAGLAGAGRLLVHGIALRPGETAGLGEAGGRPVLLLPGRPEAALAVYLALGQPLVAALSGATPSPAIRATLARKVASGIGLSEIVYLRRVPGGVEPLGAVDLPLRRLCEAEAALLVPPDCEGYPEGKEVEVLDL
ncbi:molybdopterin-binding protein [Methylobacterium sp. Leaf118]|uniref:molybdopterin-binding protein n=1 Tax=Methylobacterium sp. Leaf118 TaxID=2876562 RepID=UPI001E3A30E6|nr:molybdopterin-binding protein [Methylobacterium sp. Leaf118]